MVAGAQSRFTFLAADLLSAAQPSPTPLQKTRVGGFRRHASGQTSSRRRCRSIITPGSRGCVYKTMSGRHEWLNQDPIQERGGINLYAYVGNNPVNKIDPLGLFGADPESLPSSNGSQVNGVPALTISVPKGPCGGKATVTNNDSAKELAMMMMAGGGLIVGGGLVLGLAGPDEIAAGGAETLDVSTEMEQAAQEGQQIIQQQQQLENDIDNALQALGKAEDAAAENTEQTQAAWEAYRNATKAFSDFMSKMDH